jgi:hypothetical protein
MPDGLDQFGGIRRRAWQLRADAATGGTDDLRVLERCTYNEYGLTDNRRLRGRSCRATEVHAQIAVSIFVRTLTEAVRRKGTQRYDQRDGRNKRDQTNTEETPAQGGATCQGTNKRSL